MFYDMIQGYRETQRELAEMAEKTAAVDSEKGATLEQISAMVEQISREFKSKMIQVQPLMAELKVCFLSTYSCKFHAHRFHYGIIKLCTCKLLSLFVKSLWIWRASTVRRRQRLTA